MGCSYTGSWFIKNQSCICHFFILKYRNFVLASLGSLPLFPTKERGHIERMTGQLISLKIIKVKFDKLSRGEFLNMHSSLHLHPHELVKAHQSYKLIRPTCCSFLVKYRFFLSMIHQDNICVGLGS